MAQRSAEPAPGACVHRSGWKKRTTVVVAAVLVSSCADLIPPDYAYSKSCGVFSKEWGPEQPFNFPIPEMRTTISFTHKPEMCSVPCNCGQIAFVQMIRFIDQTDEHMGEFFQPHDEQSARKLEGRSELAFDGWAIDREEGKKWAYSQRYDNGSWATPISTDFTDTAWHIKFGRTTPSADAVLRDAPKSDRARYRTDVLVAPVCVDARSACNDQVLGYFGYAFSRTQDFGTPQQQLGTPVPLMITNMAGVLDSARAKWNEQDGKEPLFLKQVP